MGWNVGVYEEMREYLKEPLKNAARLSSTPKSICSCFPRQLLDVCFPTTLCVSGSRQPATRVRRDNTLRLRRFLCPRLPTPIGCVGIGGQAARRTSSFFRGSLVYSRKTWLNREKNEVMTLTNWQLYAINKSPNEVVRHGSHGKRSTLS